MFNLGQLKNGQLPLGGLLGGGAGPNGGSGMVGSNNRAKSRLILRSAFGNSSRFWSSNGLNLGGTSPLNTPNSLCGQFRAAYNAGDILTSLTGGGQAADPKYGIISNQVSGQGSMWNIVKSDGINYGKATYVGNPRYVYDSSDFTRFKNLKSQLRSYNIKSFGGNIPQNQYTVLARVR